MATLSAKIPAEACRLIIGIKNPAEAWERLNKRYGDEQLVVIAAMKDLIQLKMPQGFPFVRMEALVQAVRLDKTRLKAFGQENQLFASCFTIGTLVEKLKLTMQSSWCHYLAE